MKRYDATVYEMANLRKNRTGLPFNIWLIDKPNHQHGPRIKVQQDYNSSVNDNELVSITIEDEPKVKPNNFAWKLTRKDKKLCDEFIRLNKDNLIEVYYGRLDFIDFVNFMMKGL